MAMVGAIIVLVIGLLSAIAAGVIYLWLSHKPGGSGGDNDGSGPENVKEIKMQTNEYRIKYSELQFGSLLGKGNQGEVYRTKLRSTDVAVKKIDCRKVEPDY
mmetsp:Transcript_5768/g.10608  ORF Transcript_5768/g.10608 Transcript_5768/m.10608 type:complete len:102 (+) Transcript_5768:214-519(+)